MVDVDVDVASTVVQQSVTLAGSAVLTPHRYMCIDMYMYRCIDMVDLASTVVQQSVTLAGSAVPTPQMA